jgi:hypothetical protein
MTGSSDSYEDKWPALFVDWGQEKIAEWQARLDDKHAPPTHVEAAKLKYDISVLKQSIKRVSA